MKIWHNLYHQLTTKQNVFIGWKEFRVGKKRKKDVILFENDLDANLEDLYQTLKQKIYQPGEYIGFCIKDPKIRLIHKATVRDRVVHHIVSNKLGPIFEPTFIAHSYSCRKNKGTHRGVLVLQKMALKVSKNNSKICWSVKCDVRKFFASVNHKILFEILSERIRDEDFLNLLWKIISSFYSDRTTDPKNKKGIPIGNLTSQFFSNIYMNELDQFIKHELKVKYYLRYADDFVILSESKEYLEKIILPIEKFLNKKLDLGFHPNKIIFRKLSSGIDFLGYIIFPYHILPRTKTKRRLLRKIKAKIDDFKSGKITEEKLNETIQSYLGYLSHAKSHQFQKHLKNLILFWLTE